MKDPINGRQLPRPPSGFVAGIYERGDLARGVSKPPANEVVNLAVGLDHDATDAEQTVLNRQSINCIRSFGSRGFRVWGGRTLSADPERTRASPAGRHVIVVLPQYHMVT